MLQEAFRICALCYQRSKKRDRRESSDDESRSSSSKNTTSSKSSEEGIDEENHSSANGRSTQKKKSHDSDKRDEADDLKQASKRRREDAAETGLKRYKRDSATVYVGNLCLEAEVARAQLKRIFGKVGVVKRIWLPRRDFPTYAFVSYKCAEDAALAIREVHGT